MRNNFFIIGLPRSGTAWLSNFLTWGDAFCYHEGMYGHTDVLDYRKMLDDNTAQFVGDSDTMLTLMLPWIMDIFPHAKFVFVQRNRYDVAQSLIKKGFSAHILEEADRALQWGIQNIPSLTIPFEDLFRNVETIWDYIGLPDFPADRYNLLKEMRVDDAERFLRANETPDTSIMKSFIRESVPWH